ncbi:RDD family protein [Roseateles amylovorans]|uniref:RDD family protein n=1 Tax=Roseateles amylovorans TaxID=2978473 RepID=A0ABY6B349_9BURK|nr:RDD family protein [Roseateles amylovorans]UXH79649.1 RDD family protein [Roseateles amylovorans]
MSNTVDERFAAPQAHVADIASGDVALAGRWIRLLAAILDGLIIGGAAWLVGMIPGIESRWADQTAQAGFTGFNPYALVIGGSLFLLIQSWPLLTRGQTIGKMICGLRIVRSDGGKPDPWRLLGLRYGLGFVMNTNVTVSTIYGLIDGLLIFRSSRQCLHDTLADTKVIKL